MKSVGKVCGNEETRWVTNLIGSLWQESMLTGAMTSVV